MSQSNKEIILKRIFYTFIAICTLASIALCGYFLTLLLFGRGSQVTSRSAGSSNYELMKRYDAYVTNTVSDAVSGIIAVEKVYFLNDNDQVAPEPDQQRYGITKDPAVLKEVLAQAQPLMDGQQILFDPDAPIVKFTSVNYYLDETIFAITWKQEFLNCVYTFSEIKIQHPSQFRRFLADGKFGSDKQYLTSEMAANVNAVVASAGDFYKYRADGAIVYQGNIERYYNAVLDVCLVDGNGDLHFIKNGQMTEEAMLQEYMDKNDVRFSISFGPILIVDGKSAVPSHYPIGEINERFSRAALCQLGPLHYVVVTANKEFDYISFPTLAEFANVLIERGITNAYTLDGGQTATLVMNDQVINRVSYGSERYISDIIYFATAMPNKK